MRTSDAYRSSQEREDVNVYVQGPVFTEPDLQVFYADNEEWQV
jgi:hypothetical protein